MPENVTPGADLSLLEAAAREAGAIARASFGKTVETWSKGDAGPVTEVDLAIDKYLNEMLLGARPEYGWLSEESVDNTERLDRARVFVVDPIDGTLAFIQRQPQFSISIGIVEDGRAISGVVYNPMTDELYLGGPGLGATMNRAPIKVSDPATLEGARIIGKAGAYENKKWPTPWPSLDFIWRHSIALRLAHIAAGDAEATLLFGLKHNWDIVGGAAIVEGAGGLITDMQGRPLRFNLPDPRTPGLIASGPRLNPLLIERLSHLPDPQPPQDAPP